MKYIDSEKLTAEIERQRDSAIKRQENLEKIGQETVLNEMLALKLNRLLSFIYSLQQEHPDNMIQWTGNNLKEVIDFTGKSPRFGEWFNSWEEYENYVHTHNDILKLFCEDGSHYEVPVGAWIVKTPDGYNVPSVSKYIQQDHLADASKMVEPEHIADVSKMMEQREVDLEKEYQEFCKDFPFPWEYVNREYIDKLCLSVARHFYGLRNRALEEAARHVYESWMGGTMDDIRRDMVELGKVLNARKED